MGELENAPVAGGGLPTEFALANVGSQVNQRIAFDLAVGAHPPGDRGDIAVARIALGFKGARSFHLHDGSFQALGRVARGYLPGNRLTGPPFLVENPQLKIILLRRVQADVQVAPPPCAQPVIVRARFRGEASVAALGDLADFYLQTLLALIPVQPEQRAEQAAGLAGQLAELLFNSGKIRGGVAGFRTSRQRLFRGAEQDDRCSAGGRSEGKRRHSHDLFLRYMTPDKGLAINPNFQAQATRRARSAAPVCKLHSTGSAPADKLSLRVWPRPAPKRRDRLRRGS